MLREILDSIVGVVFLLGMLWLALNLEAINTPEGFGLFVDGIGGYFWQYGN